MPKNQIITKSSRETKMFAKKILKKLLKLNSSKSLVICLYGDLGGGKTTFTQGLAKELGIKETVNSPTFLIMKKYKSSKNNKKYTLYHFDCYRISNQQEILDLGWEEIINSKNNIIVIEWPEKIEKILPKERLDLKFEFIDKNTRKISF
ncbi:MAG: tRNA (adenosine(37)-N6)-threonylcarbamoyltransferase complex ATPase subunit type 1 TsaE [Candidatus Pacebacteria bacterium]|nr:tRNA (adenosine(37)-N6)-threonylcarbamoyltransferase complex ATPase subunit type 1 TsaE [Candidatus Paceibacterota bacterium]